MYYKTVAAWSKTMCFSTQLNTVSLAVCLCSEPQVHLEWGWDTEHVSPICQTICQHSHNTPAKCGCRLLKPLSKYSLLPSLNVSMMHYFSCISFRFIYFPCFVPFPISFFPIFYGWGPYPGAGQLNIFQWMNWMWIECDSKRKKCALFKWIILWNIILSLSLPCMSMHWPNHTSVLDIVPSLQPL